MSSGDEAKKDETVTNGHVPNSEKGKNDDKGMSKKVFLRRNSLLTDLMEVNHLQSVYNISVAVCFLLFLSSVLLYLAAPDKFWGDINRIKHGLRKIPHFLLLWISFHILAYLVLRGFGLWIEARNKIHKKAADIFFTLLFIAASVIMFTATTYASLKWKIPPITGFTTMCEQVRIFMKMYSFVKESVPRALKYNPAKDGRQEHNLCPGTQHYFYYLFAPTLIYRDSYPKTERINWDNFFSSLFKFAAVIFITYCALMRFNFDVFKDVGLRPFNRVEAALIASGSMAVGAIMMFLMFYGILHCWLNLMGELLRFGDKLFYQDWWNSTSFSQYYRRMNNVVYDWLHAYIYQESQRMGLPRRTSLLLVFFVSASVHEYIICVAIGFFYPVLCVTYCTIGVFLIFFTSGKTSQFWNTFMWGMLFSGWGVVISCYSAEWFARINCPKQETALDFFIPRSWSTSCHIIDFS